MNTPLKLLSPKIPVTYSFHRSVLGPQLRCVSGAFDRADYSLFFTWLPGHTLSWFSSSSLGIPFQSPRLVSLLSDFVILEGPWTFSLGLFSSSLTPLVISLSFMALNIIYKLPNVYLQLRLLSSTPDFYPIAYPKYET